MKKQIKTLVAAGLISIVSAGSIVTSHADSRTTACNNSNQKLQIICVNSVKDCFKYKKNCNVNKPSNSNCNVNKPTDSESSNNNAVKPEKPNTTPENKPSVPGDSNSNNNNNNNNNNSNNTVKPENKPESNASFSAQQQEVLNLVNQERAKVGAKPLTLNKELSNVATTKSQDMINKNYFDHTSPTYGSPFDMMKQFGISYRTAGENIAMGQRTPAEVMNSWMNSEGHRKNILNPNFTELGVGIAKASNGQLYWTQMFIGK